MAKTRYGKARRVARRRYGGVRRGGRTLVTKMKGFIIPDKALVKLPFVDCQNINRGTLPAAYGQKTYTLNNIYDPEPGTALNSEPLGWGEWQMLYNKYRVYGVSYEITLTNLSADTSVAGCLYINSDAGTGSMSINPTSWLSQPHSRRFTIGNREGASKVTLKGYVSLPKYLGMTSAQYKMSPDTLGTFTGSVLPSEPINMFINILNVNASVTTPSVQAMVRLTYHTEIFDRAQLLSTGTGGD